MTDFAIYPSEPSSSDTPPDYPLLCRSTPTSHSFYISTSFSLITQMYRLKATGISQDIIDKSTNLIVEGLQLLDAQSSLSHYANYFPIILNSSLTGTLADLETQLASYALYLSCGMRVLLAGAFNRQNEAIECNNILSMRETQINEEVYLEMLSSVLDIAIEFFVGGNRDIYYEPPNMTPKLMISVIVLSRNNGGSEYAAMKHKNFEEYARSGDRNLLGTHPFVYSPAVQRVPSLPREAMQNLRSLGNEAGPQSVEGGALMKDTINCLFEILITREWKFSKEEAKNIKPKIKELQGKIEYKGNAEKVLRRMRKHSCGHGFKYFVKMECQKTHCIECLQDEINLKSLAPHQILCACRQRLTDTEIQYYFSSVVQSNPVPRSQQPRDFPNPSDHGMIIEENKYLHKGGSEGNPGISNPVSVPGGMLGPMSRGVPNTGPVPVGFYGSMPGIGLMAAQVPDLRQVVNPGLTGMPTGPGLPPANEVNNSPQQRISFCSKCRLPIKNSDLAKVNNMLYHRGCT